jgi:hypothetical protein
MAFMTMTPHLTTKVKAKICKNIRFSHFLYIVEILE